MSVNRKTLIEFINNADHVRAGTGSPNPDTRDGFYVTCQKGIMTRTFFLGQDLTNDTFIIEQVG